VRKFFIFDFDIQGKKRALLGTCFIYLEDNFIAPLKNVELYVFSNHVTTFGTQRHLLQYIIVRNGKSVARNKCVPLVYFTVHASLPATTGGCRL
jgi:hypothetical protein